MQWSIITSVFFLSTVKFMFAAIPGSVADIPYYHTYFSTVLGGMFGAAIFYFSAELLMKRNHRKLVEKRELAEEKGKPFIEKKKFTKMNKFIVRLKLRFGIYGISFWAPFFLSVPIGSIITAKFYGKKKITFFLICIGMLINGSVTTGLAYIFK